MRDLARYTHRKDVLTCDQCRQVVKNREPNCDECEIYKLRSQLEPRQWVSHAIIANWGGLLVDGMGGINAPGLKWILEMEEIIDEDKPFIIADIMAFLQGAREAQEPETPPPEPPQQSPPKQSKSLPKIPTRRR